MQHSAVHGYNAASLALVGDRDSALVFHCKKAENHRGYVMAKVNEMWSEFLYSFSGAATYI
jgi:hypothetical protein